MTAHYQTTHLGAFAARKRVACWWGEAKPAEGEVEAMRIREVNACWLLPLKPFNQATNLLQPPEFIFTRDPNIVTTGDPWLPKPVGHLLEKSTGERHLVHSHRGPACGPRLRGHPLKVPGGTLLEDGSGNVRPLLPEELWEMQGGEAAVWNETPPSGRSDLVQAMVREPGWQAAFRLLQATHRWEGSRAGVYDPDEMQAHEQLEVWLRAWGRNPKRPSNELALVSWKIKEPMCPPTHAGSSWKAGAPKRGKAKKPYLTPTHELVAPAKNRQEEAEHPPKGNCGPPRLKGIEALDHIGMEAVLAKLADSTRRVYASGWKQWVLFNSGAKSPLFLTGEERSARYEDEQRPIRFVVFLHQIMGRSIGGIRQRLSAIRYAHITAGYPDPLSGKPRLWSAVAGLQRWEGAPARKLPVTPTMLRWLNHPTNGSNRTGPSHG